MNMTNMMIALELLVQGMAGIFVVLGVIALLVMGLQRMDRSAQDKRKNRER